MCIHSIQCIHSDVNGSGIQCIRVIRMKKTENISFRTDPEIKKQLEAFAEEKKWSLSQLVELIVRQWAEDQKEQGK